MAIEEILSKSVTCSCNDLVRRARNGLLGRTLRENANTGAGKVFLKYISRHVKRMLTIRAIRYFYKKVGATGKRNERFCNFTLSCIMFIHSIHSDHVTHFTTTCTVHVSSPH